MNETLNALKGWRSMRHAKRLGVCPKCQERSVRVKIYAETKRVEFCTNKGCGYTQQLPDLPVARG